MLQSFDGGVSPILDSLPRASYRSGRRRNIEDSEVLEKAVLIAKHLITVS